MSELQEVQRAGAKVIEDFVAAHRRGEVTDHVFIAVRLTTVALMMKLAYRTAALKIAQEYADLVGLDADLIEEQVSARIYEHVQLARIEEPPR
jgi:hypothetical protein